MPAGCLQGWRRHGSGSASGSPPSAGPSSRHCAGATSGCCRASPLSMLWRCSVKRWGEEGRFEVHTSAGESAGWRTAGGGGAAAAATAASSGYRLACAAAVSTPRPTPDKLARMRGAVTHGRRLGDPQVRLLRSPGCQRPSGVKNRVREERRRPGADETISEMAPKPGRHSHRLHWRWHLAAAQQVAARLLLKHLLAAPLLHAL